MRKQVLGTDTRKPENELYRALKITGWIEPNVVSRCHRCDIPMEKTNKKQIYCPECRKLLKSRRARKYQLKARLVKKIKDGKPLTLGRNPIPPEIQTELLKGKDFKVWLPEEVEEILDKKDTNGVFEDEEDATVLELRRRELLQSIDKYMRPIR